MKKTVEEALVNGIKNTIEQFQKSPYSYFTESDIHSLLINNIKKGNPDALVCQDKNRILEVSLIHQEYPTNFRYKKSELLCGYIITKETKNNVLKKTSINAKDGDRGNYDLAILNPDYVKKIFDHPKKVQKETNYNKVTDLSEALKHIINKDIDYAKKRCVSLKDNNKTEEYYVADLEENIDYAVEVKFIHPFNARNKNMLYEVIKDNNKLNLTNLHTNGFTKTINLVFCSSEEKSRRVKKSDIYNIQPVISKIKEYINRGSVMDFDGKTEFQIPKGVINIFIESYLAIDEIKSNSPILINLEGDSNDLFEKLKNEL